MAAIEVRHGFKKYGRNGPPVLNNINLTVQKGTIYGLIGGSGSGKTTLLSCITTLQYLDAGEIRVFGAKPSPGPKIGYMPQETALYNIFKISEVFQYYGRLYGMRNHEIQKRVQFLKAFLQLPDISKIVGTNSGGQQRRISLAISILHQPKLLILDEPTVSLDPVLRNELALKTKK